MESKSKKSKKNKTSDFKQADNASGDDPQIEKDLKKKKSKSGEGFHIEAPSALATVSASLSEEDKSKRRNKNKKNDRHGEIVIKRIDDGTLEKGSLEVDGEVKTKKERKKWKSNTVMGDGEEFTENKKAARGEKDAKGRKSKGEKENVGGVVGESIACSERKNVEKMKRKREKQKEYENLGDEEVDGQLTLSKTIGDKDEVSNEGKKKKKANAVENGSKDPKLKRKSKKVSFSGVVEVFPSTVRGKRFTKEEDEIVKESVLNYIKAHGLGDEGMNMVMHCKDYPGVKNCWKEIGAALPHRPYTAIYYRAHNLFERSDTRQWTEEDLEFVQKAQKEHGNDWKAIAAELGRHRVHVKDAWRRIKLQGQKKGHWSQKEHQHLYDLVNFDLQMKLDAEEKLSKHGMLRDNIPWTAISDKLTTRSDAICCMKWYGQLTSSMVAEGLWSDCDDYRLIGALYDMDASCERDVDWDNLLQHRSGDVCRKRWNQMVLHIGYHGCKPFAEQVETLVQRYCPNLAETREAWDSKPVTQ